MEIAYNADLSIDDSEGILQSLVDKGIVEKQITDKGNFVYVFTGFMSEEEKRTSRDPLDW